MDLPVFQFVLLSIYHFLGHHWEEPGSLFPASHQTPAHTVKGGHIWVAAMSPYLCYWLLILATVHNTKIIIARKLFHYSGY